MNVEDIFWKLYRCPVEDDVHTVLQDANMLESRLNWKPYGGNENNYGVFENQQASPIPALVEKITNGIDAILERRCLEEGIDPESSTAPKSLPEGVAQFFPDHKNWDLPKHCKRQSEMLQIVADGPRNETSLIIFDEGVGQAPDNFENTFLSLLNGNKNKINFVQGKYNMGGAGAVIFCGKHRYQLIASKRFDNNTDFGFTLVRRHPLTQSEQINLKSTWYEYLVVDGRIPSFNIDEIDLGLTNRKFRTGSIIKLYSYDLPPGSKSDIARDLNQSLNEYLFRPALPILTVETKARYPKDKNPERYLFGLQRRLEADNSEYVEDYFSEEINCADIGKLKVTSYIFKAKAGGRNVKEARKTIQREFFKNNMAVIFSINGQVHGHLTSEFITRSLKFHLLKDYLLVHVDCTGIKTKVRNELFMASRDRLRNGTEAKNLRELLAKLLKNGRLKEVNALRKASLNLEGNDAEDIVRNMAKNLPLEQNLAKLLDQTFGLENPGEGKRPRTETKEKKDSPKPEKPKLSPQRFPSTFNIEVKGKDESGLPLVMLPAGGSKTIRFSTDVEDHYFDRVSEPGELHIAFLGPEPSKSKGGNEQGELTDIKSILDVVQSSPTSGVIRVRVNATDNLTVGDAITLCAELSRPSGPLKQVFMVRITDPENKKPSKNRDDIPDNRLCLPKFSKVYKESREGGSVKTWTQLEDSGISMDHSKVVHPYVNEQDVLDTVYVNMDSKALLNHRSGLKTPEAISFAENRYFTAVYFHTLFLFAITKNRKYSLYRESDEAKNELVDISDYISDLFTNSYAQFLLSFDTKELINVLES